MSTTAITLPKALELAVKAYERGKFAEAEQICQQMIAAKPGLSAPLLLLATVQLALGRPTDALTSYEQVLTAWPSDATALHNRGTALYELNRCELALTSYDRALAVRPDAAATHNNRGNALRELKRLPDALASYDEAIVRQPDYPDALHNRAALLYHLKRFEEALASYNEAITLKPDHADALFQRGAVLQEMKRPQEAFASREKAISLKPELGPLYRPLVLPDAANTSETKPGLARGIASEEQSRRVIWCLGMHASGSTWTYNVARQIAMSVYPTLPVQEHFVLTLADVAFLDPRGRTHIVKTHNIDDDDAVAALSEQTDAMIITIRDPRDAVTSLMQYHPFSSVLDLTKPSEAQKAFSRSLSLIEKSARLCARFAGERTSLLLRYESGFTDDPTTLDRIAETFCRSLAPPDKRRIFASSRRANIDAFIADLAQQRTTRVDISSGDLMDPITHWHTFHAGRTGEIGKWRRNLTEPQVLEIEERLGDWMDRFSYQRCKIA